MAHLGLKSKLPAYDFIHDRVWHLISGGSGVQIFFTLSGFLITFLLLKEREKNGRISIKKFYIRRFLRLFPPQFIFLVMASIAMIFGKIDAAPLGLVFSFFYSYNYLPKNLYTGELGHTWSLALEEQFYLVWPFILQFIRRKSVTLLLISIILIICLMAQIGLARWTFDDAYRSSLWFIPAVAPILIGALIAYVHFNFNVQKLFSKWYFLLIGLLIYAYPLYVPIDWIFYKFIVQAIGIGLVLVWMVLNQESFLIKILNIKPLNYIGKISYGLYVYQGFFLRTGPSDEWWMQTPPVNIILVISIAVVSYQFVELPISRYKNKFR